MDDDPSHIKTEAQGAKLARALGPHHAVLMRAHGSTLVAESLPALLVDQGDADQFLVEQLKPELLAEACTKAGIDLTLRMQPGYDHSYYFISTFMADHLTWHAARL